MTKVLPKFEKVYITIPQAVLILHTSYQHIYSHKSRLGAKMINGKWKVDRLLILRFKNALRFKKKRLQDETYKYKARNYHTILFDTLADVFNRQEVINRIVALGFHYSTGDRIIRQWKQDNRIRKIYGKRYCKI